MRLIKTFLPHAVLDGDDLEARGMMLAAASMGSTAFQKGLGAIHSLSHPVGARYDTHHGLTNAVFFPYVNAHNRPELLEDWKSVVWGKRVSVRVDIGGGRRHKKKTRTLTQT